MLFFSFTGTMALGMAQSVGRSSTLAQASVQQMLVSQSHLKKIYICFSVCNVLIIIKTLHLHYNPLVLRTTDILTDLHILGGTYFGRLKHIKHCHLLC